MIAYEFGNNGHTKEFILYYFPESGILIVGAYYYSSENIKASSRAVTLNKFLTEQKIKVKKLYPTWSPIGMKEYSTMKDLKESEMIFQENAK